MRTAILVDSVHKEVRKVEIGEGIADIYKYLDCDTFDVVNLGAGVDMFIDDEGLLKEGYIDEDTGEKHNMTGIQLRGYPQVIMGNGLVMGCNDEGESVDAPVSVAQVEAVVTFVEYDNPADKPEPHIEVMSW